MTDRELLERAARAAGLILGWSSVPDLSPRIIGSFDIWNPLVDDGDALRLAVKLRLVVYHSRTRAFVSAHNPAIECTEIIGPCGADAATRRAIVRAAAALAPEES